MQGREGDAGLAEGLRSGFRDEDMAGEAWEVGERVGGRSDWSTEPYSVEESMQARHCILNLGLMNT